MLLCDCICSAFVWFELSCSSIKYASGGCLWGRVCWFRRRALQMRAQEAKVSSEEEEEMLRDLERRETEFMRLQRHKVGIDDFELLTVIGKGAFGEVG